jgi:hypothetical protein
MSQDTGKFRTNTKDQYYTKASVAKRCVDAILTACPEVASYQWIEPSAGSGAFLKAVGPDAIGIDLEPAYPGVHKGDFLAWEPTTERPRIFFGNPPFGRQGCLAKAFIKHAARHGSILAFILPRSFVKPSMSRAFPMKFHCVYSEELEKNAFEVNGDPYDVPCVFQIWVKKEEDRVLEAVHLEEGFSYVKAGQPFDIAFKRVGGLAGKCSGPGTYNPQFHYFLKLDQPSAAAAVIEAVNRHVFPSNTVGPRSLSKSEANEVLNRVIACVGAH